MDKAAIIKAFCDTVNAGLPKQENRAAQIYADLKQQIGDDQDLLEILDDLQATFTAAFRPEQFSNMRIMEPGLPFDQCYALLSAILDPDVLDSKEALEEALTAETDGGGPNTYILIGRFWTVPGTQVYTADGLLAHFTYDPMTLTTSVVAAISGDYIPLRETPEAGMGAVGQAASRAATRGSGHGKFVTEAFEAEMLQIASARGETLKLMILEAEAGAREFWARRGYRWPAGVEYIQPPIRFDEATGEALSEAKPELLMIKVPDAEVIDRPLLIDAVRSMYRQWYLPETVSESASTQIESLVMGELFAQFLNSLPSSDEPIRLKTPPSY